MVVTAAVVGDVVEEIVGPAADVSVVMPPGADPHQFTPSVRQAEAMADADLLVLVGAGFEEGLAPAIDGAADAGAPVFTVTDHVDLLDSDPHVWTDPVRMREVVDALAGALADVGIDVGDRAARYGEELAAAHDEAAALLATVPADRRELVTDHRALAYFADRYGFEIVGTIVPSATSGAEPSASHLEELVAVIEARDVPAVFVDAASSPALAETVAEAADAGVEVVTVHAESLGGDGSAAGTYLGMVRTNARLVHDALAGADGA